ncbi:odorant receptor 4-like isoform X2 [Agrilus planipennis]|uniref:Odorant receptor 4-like isoform X2 n=1 Tax=Agrilus planipennis TaxID=224129 RepID=A0A1W4X6W6_AGRPL|nr:odorant receptor 4-like isoform X2 [Agrilus planipennis]
MRLVKVKLHIKRMASLEKYIRKKLRSSEFKVWRSMKTCVQFFSWAFQIVAFCQILTILPCLVNIIGTDLLLIALCTELMIQLRILSSEMGNLKFDQVKSKEDKLECNRRLKKCVKYHIFLLRVLRRVQKVFSPILLYHPVLLCLTMCFETYIITECLRDMRLMHLLIKSVLYVMSELLEFAIYCISAEFVAFEAINIGQALYDSSWHKQYLKAITQSIPFILMRSNKEIKFTASGLFKVKIRTILQSHNNLTVLNTYSPQS